TVAGPVGGAPAPRSMARASGQPSPSTSAAGAAVGGHTVARGEADGGPGRGASALPPDPSVAAPAAVAPMTSDVAASAARRLADGGGPAPGRSGRAGAGTATGPVPGPREQGDRSPRSASPSPVSCGRAPLGGLLLGGAASGAWGTTAVIASARARAVGRRVGTGSVARASTAASAWWARGPSPRCRGRRRRPAAEAADEVPAWAGGPGSRPVSRSA